MDNTIIRIYDKFSDAEKARDGLLAAGFQPEQINLAALNDEAGAVEGNFALEYKDADHDNDRSAFDSLFGSGEANEGLGRSAVAWRGNFMMSVEAADPAQVKQALDIAEQFGGIDIDRNTPRTDLPDQSRSSSF